MVESMTPSETKRPETGVPIRYVLVLWLLAMSAVAYLDRTNISVAGIEVAQEFAISKIRLGWVFSAFLVGYAGFQIPAGLLARRLGSRRAAALGGGGQHHLSPLDAGHGLERDLGRVPHRGVERAILGRDLHHEARASGGHHQGLDQAGGGEAAPGFGVTHGVQCGQHRGAVGSGRVSHVVLVLHSGRRRFISEAHRRFASLSGRLLQAAPSAKRKIRQKPHALER